MKFLRIAPALILLATLAACAPVGRIILLPEPGGKSGAVEVKTKAGTAVLSQPYQTASFNQNGDLTSGETNATTVAEQYKLLLSQQPPAVSRFTLCFAEGSRLTNESEVQLEQILAEAAKRPGSEIFVTGHTDSVGTVEANDALSLQRARLIRDSLIKSGFKPELIVAIGRGERELLVPTVDETEEPRNRRAEVVVQ